MALIDMTSGRQVSVVGPGQLTVAYDTSSGGLAYWMTDYSVSHGLPNGLLKDEVTASVNAAPASPTPYVLPPSLAGAEWTRLPTNAKVVALTFDAGGNDAGVTPILAALAADRVPGTFFMTGRWVEVYPARARQIGALYPVGNHTYDHPHLTALTDAQVQEEVAQAGLLISSATGRDTRPLFRFPYGDSDSRTLADVHALGYGGIGWTVDTLGWEGRSNGQTPDTVLRRVLAKLQPGEIVLMHLGAATDGTTLDADALPAVVREIQARGYSLAVVGDFA
ncbi:MAG TPA: polysaccharide deacetylase family protein [Candidatus Baltobacterales bacterium]|nr:polysaccharide deacetylase family protein [Candidatus Baltobacterales bacterium]